MEQSVRSRLSRGTSALRYLTLTALLLIATDAWPDDPAGPGLDLMVLVDRSGSMSSHASSSILDALPLTLNVLAWSSRAAHLNHRLGVVSFGSNARVDVPLTLVEPERIAVLRNRIAALDSRSLGNTDFVPPFRVAAEGFRALPEDPGRRRAILLLTDGAVAVAGVPPTVSAARLRRLLDTELQNPPVTIDVLLLGTAAGTPVWRGDLHTRVHRTTGEHGDLLMALHRAVADIIGTRSTQRELSGASDTVILPPYLDLAVFDVFHGGAAQKVAIFAPGASEPLHAQMPGVEDVGVGQALSTVIVRRPAPGPWTFRKPDPAARVTLLSQQFFPRGSLVAPVSSPPARQHDAVTIRYRLNDGNGRPLQEIPGYPLSVDVSLSRPGGERTVLPMMRERRPSSAVYHSMTRTQCDVPGRYWTEVRVTTADSRGDPVRVFEDRWSGFSVEPAEEIDSPAASKEGRGLRVAMDTSTRAAVMSSGGSDSSPSSLRGFDSRVLWLAGAAVILTLLIVVTRSR